MRFMLIAILALTLAGCALFKGKNEPSAQAGQVMAYLDQGQDKAALALAEDMVRANPDDYSNYLILNTVHLAEKDLDAAQADNSKALEVFQARANTYPEKERGLREAKIRESMALTALIQAKEHQTDKAKLKELEAFYEEQVAKLKQLDQATYQHLLDLTGDTGKEGN